MRHAVLVMFVAMLAAGCGARSATPPEIVIDRTACQHCGMLVSDRRYAAAIRTAEGDQVFDDIGCLLNALKGRMPEGAAFWFNDAATGEWITGTPVFVAANAIRTPMSGGIVAYGDRAAAEQAAATHQGAVITSVDALLKRSGGEK